MRKSEIFFIFIFILVVTFFLYVGIFGMEKIIAPSIDGKKEKSHEGASSGVNANSLVQGKAISLNKEGEKKTEENTKEGLFEKIIKFFKNLFGIGAESIYFGPDPNKGWVSFEPGKTIFVDQKPGRDCIKDYNPQTRKCDLSGLFDSFDTIQEAANVIQSGKAIDIREGIYTEYDIRFNASGSSGAPIVVLGYLGEKPIIQRTSIGPSSQDIFILDNAGFNNFIFSDLIIRNANYGFHFGNSSGKIYDIRIEDCEMYNFSGSGIRTDYYGVERMLIQNCVVHDSYGTEGGFDFKVNTNDYAPGTGSRKVIIRNVTSYNNHYNQQASGMIAQEATENFIYINNIAFHNGEIAFASKSGGYNIYIDNFGYDQSKSVYYLRGPWKDFGGGNEIRGNVSNYILLNNVGITRHTMSGDQGAIDNWEVANAWLYGNTFVSLENNPDGFIGPAVVVQAGGPYFVKTYSKNNIFYRINDSHILLFTDKSLAEKINNRTYFGVGNLVDGPTVRIHGVENLNCSEYLLNSKVGFNLTEYGIEEDENSSICASPIFIDFDSSNETRLQDLRLQRGSAGIDLGVSYGLTDNEDYPKKVEEFLANWSMDGNASKVFNDFSLLTDGEKQDLRDFIKKAYLYDRDGNLRDEKPDMGAYEFLAIQILPPTNLNATNVSLNSVVLRWEDNSNNEDGFKIERKKSSENYKEINQVGANINSYQDTNLSANTIYFYRVRAYNNAGNSSYSNELSVQTENSCANGVQDPGEQGVDCGGVCSNSCPSGESSGGGGGGGGGGTPMGNRSSNKTCIVDWKCGEWSVCVSGFQRRTCYDANSCNVNVGKPNEIKECGAAVEGSGDNGDKSKEQVGHKTQNFFGQLKEVLVREVGEKKYSFLISFGIFTILIFVLLIILILGERRKKVLEKRAFSKTAI